MRGCGRGVVGWIFCFCWIRKNPWKFQDKTGVFFLGVRLDSFNVWKAADWWLFQDKTPAIRLAATRGLSKIPGAKKRHRWGRVTRNGSYLAGNLGISSDLFKKECSAGEFTFLCDLHWRFQLFYKEFFLVNPRWLFRPGILWNAQICISNAPEHEKLIESVPSLIGNSISRWYLVACISSPLQLFFFSSKTGNRNGTYHIFQSGCIYLVSDKRTDHQKHSFFRDAGNLPPKSIAIWVFP